MQLGLELALMGMGTVFIFLILLIFLTTLMSRVIGVLERKMTPIISKKRTDEENSNQISDDVLNLVITTAIRQHQFSTVNKSSTNNISKEV